MVINGLILQKMNLGELKDLANEADLKKHKFLNRAVSPSGESKDYYLNQVKAAYYYNFINAGIGYITNSRRLEFVQNRLIATGRNDMKPLIEKIKGKYKDDKRFNYINLDWESLKLVSKYRDIVIGKLEELNWDVVATAINPEAGAEKEAIKWKLWAETQNKEWIDMMNGIAEAKVYETQETAIPINSKRDLDLVMDVGFKHIYEIAIELGIDFVANDNRWDMLKKMLLEDIFDIGRFAVDVIQNPIDGAVEWKYVDVVNLIAPDFRGHFSDNLEKIGYFSTVTIAQLMTESAEGEITTDDIKMLASRFSNKFGNPVFQDATIPVINTDATYNTWLTYNIPVFKLYFEASDRVKLEKREREYGDKVMFVSPDTPVGESKYNDSSGKAGRPQVATKKVESADIHFYHQAHWIVGTDIVYNYGKVPNQTRNIQKSKKAICPLKYYIVSHESMVDRMRAFDEAANIAWLKLQGAKAAARPSGVSIDMSALANLAIDGKGMTSDVAVKIYNESGTLYWASKNFLSPDSMVGYKPIQEMPNGLQKDYVDWLNDIQFNINMMRDLIGLNASTDATSQSPRTLSGVAELAVQGTQNALSQMTFGITFVHERMSEETAQKLQLLVRTGDITVLQNSIGGVSVKMLGSEITPHTFGFKIEARPTTEQKAEMKDAARQALVNTSDPVKGGLNYDDYFYICNMIDSSTNFKLTQLVFGYLVNRNLQRQMQMSQASSQAQSQGQMELLQMQQQSEAQRMATEQQYKLEYLQAETQAELAIIDKKQNDKLVNNEQRSDLKKGEVVQKAIIGSFESK